MSRHWEAPRIAYELAVDWAEKVQELTAGSGGAPGQPLPAEAPPIGKAWHDLRTLEQHDVLAALGAQARSAIWEIRKYHKLDDGDGIMMDVAYYTARTCEQARETLRALSDPAGSAPWKLPECSHCGALVATALISMQVAAIYAVGIDPVWVLRRLMGGIELPAPREPEAAIEG